MKFTSLCFVVAVATVFVVIGADAGCTRRPVHVSTSGQLKTAMANVKPGDDIIFAPGTYPINDDFKFGQSGDDDCPIVLTSDGNGLVTLDGAFIVNEINHINITNITVVVTNLGFCFWQCHYIYFTNVNTTGGISFTWGYSLLIQNCTIGYTQYNGIAFDYSSDAVVEDCLFTDGIGSDGISIDEHSSKIVIRNNVFYGSGYAGDYPCWIHTYSGGNEIYNNHFYNPDNHEMFAAISVLQSVPNVIRNNFIVMHPSSRSSGFAINVYRDQEVCASNKVFGGATMTNGIIDPSC